jgi:DNA repair exonuclease SbcCD ATPase subunit
VLIVGTNGLGKSSFFDAIEWGLTGKVRRFEAYLTAAMSERDYLTRRDAAPGSHRVSLQFGGEQSLTRSESNPPSTFDVIRLLKRDDWSAPIEDVSTYLAFTHFLGQAAKQRFTSRERAEQWESLKGPSGIERLEEVRRGLRGRSTQGAFRRRIESQGAAVSQAQEQLTRWQTSVLTLNRLRTAASAAGALTGAELSLRTEQLETTFSALLRRERSIGVSAGTPSERLSTMRQVIDQALADAQRQVAAFDALMGLPQRYVDAATLASADNSAVSEARRVQSEASNALANARNELTSAQSALRDTESAVSRLRSEAEVAEQARADSETLISLQERSQSLAAEISEAQTVILSKRSQIDDFEKQVSAASAARLQLSAKQAELDAAQSNLNLARQLLSLEGQAAEKRRQLPIAQADLIAATHREPILTVERNRLAERLKAAETAANEARARSSAMAASVSRIAALIGPQDQHCPVCSTEFSNGELRRLATEAATLSDALLSGAEESYLAASESYERASRELDALQATLHAAKTIEAELAAAEAAVEAIRIRVAAALEVSTGADALSVAEAAAAAIGAEVARFAVSIETIDRGARSASEQRGRLLDEIESLESRCRLLGEQQHETEREARSAQARLVISGHAEQPAGTIAGIIEGKAALIASAETALRQQHSRVADAVASEISAREHLSAATDQCERLQNRAEAAAREMEALQEQWRAAGLSGTPSQAGLISERAAALAFVSDLSKIADQQKALAASNEAAMRREEMSALISAMEADGGPGASDAPAEYESLLRSRLEEAEAKLRLSQSARVAVNALTDQLQRAAQEFSTTFLVPLNDLITDYNEALLSAPGETIRFNAAHHVDSTRFDMRLRFRDQVDQALYNTNLPPQIVLSEGQLAANGFSILCAASTAYRWSRWRALLLDDPLQHNDIIHAAAFVDVMRNLVEFENYQLIMSSHDRAEAEFIARKFDAAKMPCTVVNLTAPSREGVKFDPPRHNAAALSHLAGQLALSG